MKNFSLTMSGIWTVYGALIIDTINGFALTGFSTQCVENVGVNLIVLVGTVVAHVGRVKQGDVTALGFKKY